MPTCAVCRARDAVVFCEADGASRRARRRSRARGREIKCRHLLRARALTRMDQRMVANGGFASRERANARME